MRNLISTMALITGLFVTTSIASDNTTELKKLLNQHKNDFSQYLQGNPSEVKRFCPLILTETDFYNWAEEAQISVISRTKIMRICQSLKMEQVQTKGIFQAERHEEKKPSLSLLRTTANGKITIRNEGFPYDGGVLVLGRPERSIETPFLKLHIPKVGLSETFNLPNGEVYTYIDWAATSGDAHMSSNCFVDRDNPIKVDGNTHLKITLKRSKCLFER